MAVLVVRKTERTLKMPLADVSNTEWRHQLTHHSRAVITNMPLADVSNTEWRGNAVFRERLAFLCHLLMLVTPNGG